MTEPLVTIGIATRNRCNLLRKAILSALAQTWPAKEIVVVDDASTDGTPALAAEFPRVRWIWREGSGGYMSARNQMMAEAGGVYFCGLDDDAWFLVGDELAEAVGVMEARREVAALAFDIVDPVHPGKRERSGVRPVDTFIGCGHLLRLADVRAAGAYVALPGDYGGEEKDLCLRLFNLGREVMLMRGVHVWHDKTQMQRDRFAQHASGLCNDFVIAVLRFPLRSLAWRLPAKLVSHCLFSLRHRLFWAFVVSLGRFLWAVPAAWAQRRPVSPGALGKWFDPMRRKAPRV